MSNTPSWFPELKWIAAGLIIVFSLLLIGVWVGAFFLVKWLFSLTILKAILLSAIIPAVVGYWVVKNTG
jgi:hypothetical protein